MNLKGVVSDACDSFFVTKDMRERKAKMDEMSDAFVALPGGLGTIEELLEIITLKQLYYHRKAIVIMNINGYFDNLLAQLELAVKEHFAKDMCRQLYHVALTASEAVDYIDNYVPFECADRWLTDVDGKNGRVSN